MFGCVNVLHDEVDCSGRPPEEQCFPCRRNERDPGRERLVAHALRPVRQQYGTFRLPVGWNK